MGTVEQRSPPWDVGGTRSLHLHSCSSVLSWVIYTQLLIILFIFCNIIDILNILKEKMCSYLYNLYFIGATLNFPSRNDYYNLDFLLYLLHITSFHISYFRSPTMGPIK